MAVKIRLRQQGRNNRQTYRLVATDVRNPRGGKYLEMLGWYDPFLADNNCSVNAERTEFWLKQGAEISDMALSLVEKGAPEVYKAWQAQRQAKKVKLAAKRRAAKKAK